MRIVTKQPQDFLDEAYSDISEPLSRKDLAKRLSALFGNLEHGTVSILHGRWGSGKSTFVRKWLVDLHSEGFGTVYFDAFENDYIKDPFIALNAVLLRKLNSLDDRGGEKGRAFKKNAIAVSKKLLIASAKVGFKAATLGAISLSDLDMTEELSSSASDTVGDLSEAAVQRILDEYSQADETFSAFRASLATTPELLSQSETLGSGKVIFVVDELDRCRPDFALGLIESLKHFFKTESLHFVLVANKEFLVRSVGARYGLTDASEEYLDKFFDFSILFEEASMHRNSAPNVVYAKRIMADLIGEQTQASYDLKETISEIVGAFDLTFRQSEKIATNAALAYNSFRENEFRPIHLVSYLCFLKAIHPKIYQDIKLRKLNFDKLKTVIRLGKWEEHSSVEKTMDIFEYHSVEEIDPQDKRFEYFRGSSSGFTFLNRLDILPHLANSVIDRFSR